MSSENMLREKERDEIERLTSVNERLREALRDSRDATLIGHCPVTPTREALRNVRVIADKALIPETDKEREADVQDLMRRAKLNHDQADAAIPASAETLRRLVLAQPAAGAELPKAAPPFGILSDRPIETITDEAATWWQDWIGEPDKPIDKNERKRLRYTLAQLLSTEASFKALSAGAAEDGLAPPASPKIIVTDEMVEAAWEGWRGSKTSDVMRAALEAAISVGVAEYRASCAAEPSCAGRSGDGGAENPDKAQPAASTEGAEIKSWLKQLTLAVRCLAQIDVVAASEAAVSGEVVVDMVRLFDEIGASEMEPSG